MSGRRGPARVPHPEHDIARRLTALEARAAAAGVMVWKPLQSASGKWEAMGDGWEIIEASPSVFAGKLAARLAGTAAGDPR